MHDVDSVGGAIYMHTSLYLNSDCKFVIISLEPFARNSTKNRKKLYFLRVMEL